MKNNDNNYYCDNPKCMEKLKSLPSFKFQKIHWCNLICKFKSEGKELNRYSKKIAPLKPVKLWDKW